MTSNEVVLMLGGIAGTATLIAVLLVLVQLSRLLKSFFDGREELIAHVADLTAQLKKMHQICHDLLIEQKRVTRLTLESIDLKRAEMTGDFEIIEEPIPGTAPAAGAVPDSPPPPPPVEIPRNKKGPQFPELM